MRYGRVLVAFWVGGAWGCAKGVGDLQGNLGFGGAGVGEATGDDADADDDDDDDDDGSGPGETGSGGGFDTGGFDSDEATSAGGLPPDTSGAPPSTSGPPPATTGLPEVGSTGLPEVGTTGSPFGDTGFGTGEGGQLGDACTQNADCVSNICVNAGFATYCSASCLDAFDCPPGWLCVATTTPGLNVCY